MEISFKDISNVLKKSIAFIIILPLAFSLISYIFTALFIPKTYTGNVKLYVETSYKNATSSAYEDVQGVNYASKLVSTYIVLLDTNSFYTALAKDLNKKYTPSQLNSKISFTGIDDTEVFEATIVSQDPMEVKRIGEAIAVVAPKTISSLNGNAKLKIVDKVTLPTNPTSPNSTKNILLAFLIGLVLAIVISFIRDYFDIKIKYNEEMFSIGDIPILATIPDFEYFSKNKKVKKGTPVANK